MTAQSKTAKKLIIKTSIGILLTVSAAGYIFSDFQSYSIGGNDKTIRSVGDIKITQSQVIRERDAIAQRLGSIPQEPLIRQQLIDQSLENITLRTAVSTYATSMGIRASDIEIAQIIQSIPAFNGTDGQFDNRSFKRILLSQGVSVKTFKNNIADGVIRENFTTPIASEFPLSSKIAKNFNDFAFTTINFTAYHIDYNKLPDSIKKITPPSDDQLKQIYTEKKDYLIRPTLKNIAFAVFNANSLQNKITISDKQITDFYTDNKDKIYSEPEKRKLLQVVVDTEKKALDMYQKLIQGAGFQAVAQKIGYNADDINLGYVTPSDISDKTAQRKIFSGRVGDILQPIKTDFGYAIYFIESIQQSITKPFETVKADIQKTLFQKELSDYLTDIMPKIDDDLAGGADLSEITQKYGSSVTEQHNVTPSGTVYNPKEFTNGQPKTLKLNQNIPLDDVNQYSVGDDIPMIMSDDNQFTILKITALQEERPLSFEEAKEILNTQDIMTQKNTVLKTVIDDLKQKEDKKTLSSTYHIENKQYSVNRNGQIPNDIYYPEFNNIIFAKNKNEFFSHIDNNKAIVLVVDTISPPSAMTLEKSEDFTNKLQKNYDALIQDEAINMIRNQTIIETYDDAFNTFLAKEIDN